MGLISRFFGLREAAEAVTGVAEVFVGNRTKREAAEHAEFNSVLAQFTAEAAKSRSGWFDRFVDGLNRLPRPMLALGTLSLFIYAMAEPLGFSARMQGLALVPDQLWWLLGAIVSFYFGARELHHIRSAPPRVEDVRALAGNIAEIETMRVPARRPVEPTTASARPLQPVATAQATKTDNPVVAEWLQQRR